MIDKREKFSIFTGVFFISFAALMLEIGMTRIFSVLYEYHFAFLAVSLAISGLGAGGIFFHTILKSTKHYHWGLEISGYGFSVAILSMLSLIIFVPGLNFIYFTALLAFVPFLFTGIFLSASFERLAENSGKLYALDLSGAALGSLLVVFAFKLGGVAVVLMSGLLASFASVSILSHRSKEKSMRKITIIGLLPALLLVVLLLNILFGFLGPIPFSQSSQKEMINIINHPFYDAQIAETRWSHFGRTDLVKNTRDDGEMIFFIDGTAGASMYKFNGDFEDSSNKSVFELRNNYTGYFPISLLPSEEKRAVLIIGPGGGRDIIAAKLAGAQKIIAVEINPDFVHLVRKYSDYNGGIYNQKHDISIIIDEGRSYLRRSDDKFDVIFLSIPITKTSRSPEGYALSENFLFTVESMNDYLEHLTENGRVIIVVHHDLEVFKLLFLALEVFEKKDLSVQEALNHIYTTGPPMFQVFVIKKSPITREEAEIIHNSAMFERHYQARSMFIPYVSQHVHNIPMREGGALSVQMLNEVILGLSEGRYNSEEIIKSANVDLEPNSDDNPFFYKMNKALPEAISTLLILSLVLTVSALLIKPSFRHLQRKILYSRDFLFRGLFFSIGVGFMLIEIPLIQKFTLFLGQPVYSLSILLFSLLLGAGFGSYLSDRIRIINPIVKLIIASLSIAFIIVIYLWMLPNIFDVLLGSNIVIRMLVSVCLILPIGLAMGIPFPTGIRMIHDLKMTKQIPRMWAINGFSSVFGSVLAISLALIWGFKTSLVMGVFSYILVSILFLWKKNLLLDLKSS